MYPSGEAFFSLATARLSRKSAALPAGWAGISPELAAEALTIRDRHLRPLDRVRWSTTTRGKKPTGGQGEAQDRAARAPASLWPDWALRLMPTGLETAAVFPTAAATVLLLRGSTLTTPRVVELSRTNRPTCAAAGEPSSKWPRPGTVTPSCAVWHFSPKHWTADHLSPIDYGRRRRLAAKEEHVYKLRSVCQPLSDRSPC